MNNQHGTRPSRPSTPEALAEFTGRTYPSELALVHRPPAELSLDDEVAADPIADPDAARAHIARLRDAGILEERSDA